MALTVQVFDINNTYNVGHARPYNPVSGRFAVAGAIGVEFVTDAAGQPVTRNGAPMIARDSLGNEKIGPILLEWVPDAVATTSSQNATGVQVNAGAWVGGGSPSSGTTDSLLFPWWFWCNQI